MSPATVFGRPFVLERCEAFLGVVELTSGEEEHPDEAEDVRTGHLVATEDGFLFKLHRDRRVCADKLGDFFGASMDFISRYDLVDEPDAVSLGSVDAFARQAQPHGRREGQSPGDVSDCARAAGSEFDLGEPELGVFGCDANVGEGQNEDQSRAETQAMNCADYWFVELEESMSMEIWGLVWGSELRGYQ